MAFDTCFREAYAFVFDSTRRSRTSRAKDVLCSGADFAGAPDGREEVGLGLVLSPSDAVLVPGRQEPLLSR